MHKRISQKARDLSVRQRNLVLVGKVKNGTTSGFSHFTITPRKGERFQQGDILVAAFYRGDEVATCELNNPGRFWAGYVPPEGVSYDD